MEFAQIGLWGEVKKAVEYLWDMKQKDKTDPNSTSKEEESKRV